MIGQLSQSLDQASRLYKNSAIFAAGRDSALLQHSRFSTADLPTEDRFEAWRQSIAVMFDSSPAQAADGAAFFAEVEACHLGQLVFGSARLGGQRYSRCARRARADQLDHFILQTYRWGEQHGEFAARAFRTRPNQLYLVDLAQSFSTQASPALICNLVIPRAALEERQPHSARMHGEALQGALGTLLGEHLASLQRNLPQLTAAECPALVNATLDLLGACLAPSRDTLERARAPLEGAQLARIRRHIEAHLGSAELSPESLCRELALSRSQLYRLFEPLGGIASYIRQRRLERIHRQLSDPRETRRIGVIAYQWGFNDEAHFSRAFRRQFGYSASEARERPLPVAARGRSAARQGYEEWIRRLGE